MQLKFDSMKDFAPEEVARQVPELKQLLQLRAALQALKGPLGNMPAFRRRLEELLHNPEARHHLLHELSLLKPED